MGAEPPVLIVWIAAVLLQHHHFLSVQKEKLTAGSRLGRDNVFLVGGGFGVSSKCFYGAASHDGLSQTVVEININLNE